MIMKKIITASIVLIFLASACILPIAVDTDSNGTHASDIKDYIYGLKYDPKVDIVQDVGTTQLPVKFDDKQAAYTVTVQYQLKTTENDPSAVLGNSESYAARTYPGALLQGNHNLANGTPDPILTTDRSDLKYVISLPLSSAEGGSGFTVNPQSGSTVQDAITEKVNTWKNNPTTLASSYTSTSTEAHSQTQIAFDIDLSAEQLANLGIKAGWNEDGQSTTYVIKFTQIYYTVSVDSLPNSAEKYFGTKQTKDALMPYIYDNNMATVVDTVSYGSIVYASITTNSTSKEAQEALSLVIAGNEEKLSSSQKEIVDNSEVSVYVYGGSYTTLPSTIDGIRSMLENTAITTDNISSAKPIQYSTAFITNGQKANCNSNTQYNEAVSVITNQIDYHFDFGGGYVGNIIISYQVFDDIDDDGNYVGVRTVTDSHENMCCGESYRTTITAKHLPTITIDQLRADGYSAVVSNTDTYPLKSLYINYHGTCCNNDYEIYVDDSLYLSG